MTRTSPSRAAKPAPVLPRSRATVAFALLGVAFAVLAGRALYQQVVDNDVLQQRGAARY